MNYIVTDKYIVLLLKSMLFKIPLQGMLIYVTLVYLRFSCIFCALLDTTVAFFYWFNIFWYQEKSKNLDLTHAVLNSKLTVTGGSNKLKVLLENVIFH